jgi:hypothetical protein
MFWTSGSIMRVHEFEEERTDKARKDIPPKGKNTMGCKSSMEP